MQIIEDRQATNYSTNKSRIKDTHIVEPVPKVRKVHPVSPVIPVSKVNRVGGVPRVGMIDPLNKFKEYESYHIHKYILSLQKLVGIVLINQLKFGPAAVYIYVLGII